MRVLIVDDDPPSLKMTAFLLAEEGSEVATADNGLDALKETRNPRIIVSLSEDLRDFSFCVENNGPAVPADSQKRIFEAGVSTKGEGRGMGLSIARETLRSSGGDLTLESDGTRTAFSGFVPRQGGAPHVQA